MHSFLLKSCMFLCLLNLNFHGNNESENVSDIQEDIEPEPHTLTQKDYQDAILQVFERFPKKQLTPSFLFEEIFKANPKLSARPEDSGIYQYHILTALGELVGNHRESKNHLKRFYHEDMGNYHYSYLRWKDVLPRNLFLLPAKCSLGRRDR